MISPPAASAALASFAHDPRVPLWVQRLVLAAIAGIVLTIVLDWRFGVTAAAVIAIADTIYRSRTTAVVPAALRVTSAQRRTRRRLGRLSHAGYRALHGRAVPGTRCVIDHLVIGPAGAFAVGSERWDRRLPVRATQGGQLYHGPFDKADRLTQAQRAAEEASRVVSAVLGRHLTVRPAMVIYGPTVPWSVVRIRGVDVFCGRRLGKYLRKETKASRAARLDAGEIERIHSAAAHVLPPTG